MTTKPFNLAHAKAGAPVICEDGTRARIICADRSSLKWPLVVLLKSVFQDERIVSATIYGTTSNAHDLLMAPIMMLDNKPVHVNDVIEALYPDSSKSWDKVTVSANWKPADHLHAFYRWPKPKIKAERWITVYKNSVGRVCVTGIEHATEEVALNKPCIGWDVLRAVLIDTYEVEAP